MLPDKDGLQFSSFNLTDNQKDDNQENSAHNNYNPISQITKPENFEFAFEPDEEFEKEPGEKRVGKFDNKQNDELNVELNEKMDDLSSINDNNQTSVIDSINETNNQNLINIEEAINETDNIEYIDYNLIGMNDNSEEEDVVLLLDDTMGNYQDLELNTGTTIQNINSNVDNNEEIILTDFTNNFDDINEEANFETKDNLTKTNIEEVFEQVKYDRHKFDVDTQTETNIEDNNQYLRNIPQVIQNENLASNSDSVKIAEINEEDAEDILAQVLAQDYTVPIEGFEEFAEKKRLREEASKALLGQKYTNIDLDDNIEENSELASDIFEETAEDNYELNNPKVKHEILESTNIDEELNIESATISEFNIQTKPIDLNNDDFDEELDISDITNINTEDVFSVDLKEFDTYINEADNHEDESNVINDNDIKFDFEELKVDTEELFEDEIEFNNSDKYSTNNNYLDEIHQTLTDDIDTHALMEDFASDGDNSDNVEDEEFKFESFSVDLEEEDEEQDFEEEQDFDLNLDDEANINKDDYITDYAGIDEIVEEENKNNDEFDFSDVDFLEEERESNEINDEGFSLDLGNEEEDQEEDYDFDFTEDIDFAEFDEDKDDSFESEFADQIVEDIIDNQLQDDLNFQIKQQSIWSKLKAYGIKCVQIINDIIYKLGGVKAEIKEVGFKPVIIGYINQIPQYFTKIVDSIIKSKKANLQKSKTNKKSNNKELNTTVGIKNLDDWDGEGEDDTWGLGPVVQVQDEQIEVNNQTENKLVEYNDTDEADWEEEEDISFSTADMLMEDAELGLDEFGNHGLIQNEEEEDTTDYSGFIGKLKKIKKITLKWGRLVYKYLDSIIDFEKNWWKLIDFVAIIVLMTALAMVVAYYVWHK